MTSILFLLLKAPQDYSDLSILSEIAGEAPRSVVLLNDAALFPANKDWTDRLKQHVDEIYAMKDDVDARGLPVRGDVEMIDYPRLVDLIMEGFDQTITV